MKMPLTKIAKTIRVMNAVAAGTTNQNATGVDMSGFDAVRFVASIGTLTATQVTGMKLQSSPDNSVWTDITGGATSAMADGDSNKLLIADCIRPSTRYVRVVVTRGTANAVIDGVVATLYRSKNPPITADTSVSQSVIVGPLA